MTSVYVLQHSYLDGVGAEEAKCIGIYSSRRRAQAASRRLSRQPGFRDLPNNFHIDSYVLDMDHWTEGCTAMMGTRQVKVSRGTR